MPRPKKTVPSYLHHKASGQAYCVVRRADGSREQVYLGVYDSPESRAEYARVLANDAPPPPADTANPAVAPVAPVTVAGLILRFTAPRRPRPWSTARPGGQSATVSANCRRSSSARRPSRRPGN